MDYEFQRRARLLRRSEDVPAFLLDLGDHVINGRRIEARMAMRDVSRAVQELEEAFDEWDRE